MVDARGLRHHALVYGEDHGATILVLPGITSPAITWEFVAVPLATGARVVVLDSRGRGYTDVPASGYGMADYADDTAAIIEAMELDRPVVLGHSMGARTAAALAALHPGSHGPLVLVDPPLTGPGRPPYPFPRSVYVDGVRRSRAGMSADDVRAEHPRWPRRELEIRAEWLATCDERAVGESYDRFHDEDFFAYWERCPPPIMFVHGLESPVVPPEAIAEIRTRNPQANVVGIPAAGHMVPWDDLETFVDHVRRFVEGSTS